MKAPFRLTNKQLIGKDLQSIPQPSPKSHKLSANFLRSYILWIGTLFRCSACLNVCVLNHSLGKIRHSRKLCRPNLHCDGTRMTVKQTNKRSSSATSSSPVTATSSIALRNKSTLILNRVSPSSVQNHRKRWCQAVNFRRWTPCKLSLTFQSTSQTASSTQCRTAIWAPQNNMFATSNWTCNKPGNKLPSSRTSWTP